MSACPACQHSGESQRHPRSGFVLVTCSQCGAGIALDAVDAGAKSAPPPTETPATGAFELSPTGQHHVVTHHVIAAAANPTAEPAPAPAVTEVVQSPPAEDADTTVYLVSPSEDSVCTAAC